MVVQRVALPKSAGSEHDPAVAAEATATPEQAGRSLHAPVLVPVLALQVAWLLLIGYAFLRILLSL